MARLYSTKFVDAIYGAAGTYTLATVPTGFIWVVRNIAVDSPSGGATNFPIYEAGGATIVRLAPAANGYALVEGRWVLTAGTSLVTTIAFATTFHISGYQLSTP